MGKSYKTNIDGKTQRAQSEHARGDERETRNGCQTSRLANRDPGIAYKIY